MNILFNRKPYTNIALLLCLTLLLAQTASAQFGGRIWSAFTGGAIAVCADELDDDTTNDDIDDDDDGLIELCYLEDVDAMRHNLSGNRLRRNTKDLSVGCPGGGCKGYELVRDLDFNDDASYTTANKVIYTTGSGWQPIGDSTNSFNSIFEGNGHTISNLTINRSRTDDVGLFGYTGGSSRISNIGLLNVNINKGNQYIGGLVGQNNGSIANSYASGSVKGNSNIGGLVGRSNSASRIMNSYASGSVKGNSNIGGLVGSNFASSIADSYATGSVVAIDSTGGLVGLNGNNSIVNTYASGSVRGLDLVGGLVGDSIRPSRIMNSYWNMQTSRRSTSAGGDGKTTAELQGPTTATGIYSEWSTNNWDFGNQYQYPILKYAQACGTSQQPACGTSLRGQVRNNQPVITSPTTNTEILLGESDAGTIKTIPVAVSDDDVDDKLTLLLSAEDEAQNLVVLGTTKAEVLPNGNADRGINEDLRIRIPQTIISGMTTLRLVAKDDNILGKAMSEPVLLKVRTVVNQAPVINAISQVTVDEGDTVSINPTVNDANRDRLTYTWRVSSGDGTPSILRGVTTNTKPIRFNVPPDWINNPSTATGVTETLQLEIKASDDSLSTTRTAEVVVTKINNGVSATTSPTIDRAESATTQLVLETETDTQAIADDPDGNTTSPVKYQWQWCQSPCSWMDISGAMTSTYTIPTFIGTTRVEEGDRFRIKIGYTDGQGYSETIFTDTLAKDASADIRVRAKVFLEGPLQ